MEFGFGNDLKIDIMLIMIGMFVFICVLDVIKCVFMEYKDDVLVLKDFVGK